MFFAVTGKSESLFFENLYCMWSKVFYKYNRHVIKIELNLTYQIFWINEVNFLKFRILQ